MLDVLSFFSQVSCSYDIQDLRKLIKMFRRQTSSFMETEVLERKESKIAL